MTKSSEGERDVDAYIARCEPPAQGALRAIREAVREIAPDARESIAYGLPTFTQGRHLVHFGAFKSHVGFYPTPSGIERFDAALARYAQGKGSVRFPLDEPMPLDLIRDIVRHRLAEETAAASSSGAMAEPRVRASGFPLSDAAITRRTGRGWQSWLDLLNGWGAAERTHTEIAAWLEAEHAVDAWSAQSITVGYERALGGRDLGQRPDGFEVSASKTVGVDVAELYRAFMDEALRSRWLPSAELRLRTTTAPKTARFDWGDGPTRVLVTFTAKGPAKSALTVTHARLPDAEEAARRKAFWRERVARFADLVPGNDR